MVILLSCVSFVLADYQGAYESKRFRTGRQQREDGPPATLLQRLQPSQNRPAKRPGYIERPTGKALHSGASIASENVYIIDEVENLSLSHN